MTPKQWVRYVKRMAVCDGVSYNTSTFDLFYPLFLVSGLGVFLSICIKWEWIKNKIRGK